MKYPYKCIWFIETLNSLNIKLQTVEVVVSVYKEEIQSGLNTSLALEYWLVIRDDTNFDFTT